MSTKIISCELCDVELSSKALLAVHIEGKRHQKKLKERNDFRDLAARSVFIYGLPLHTLSSEKEVEGLLKEFGDIERIHIDPNKGSYAIVEFCSENSARGAISRGRIHFGTHCALVKERRVDFENSDLKYEQQTVNVEEVIQSVCSAGPSYCDQVDELIRLFCLSERQLAERAIFARELTTAVREYCGSEARISLFGSSVTSVGTVSSDIDATLFFGDSPLVKRAELDNFGRSKLALMTCDVSALRSRNVQPDEIARLTPADRIRFFAKILNDIRKRGIAPISDQCPILDARCPLVRILFHRKYTVDLSVDNRLGLAKSLWLKEVISSDSSSNLRRFLVAVRFWALAGGLMRHTNAMRNHFNAYILNLLCIAFLQSRLHLRALQRGPLPINIDGWDTDFSIEAVNFSDLCLSSLVKDFFVWFIQLKLKDHVLCPRLASMLTIQEFQEAFPQKRVKESFKFSHLNVQDPIELSHNVAQLVSDSSISAMRREMMLAVSRIKESPNSFAAVLGVCSSRATSSRSAELGILLDSIGKSSEECIEGISAILTELLSFRVVEEPPAKRLCFGIVDVETSRDFEVYQRTWTGRRNKKRLILKQKSSLSDWEVEKLVTDAICKESEEKEMQLRLRLIVHKNGNQARIMMTRLSGSDLDFNNIFHFLSLFIPKHFTSGVSLLNDSPMEE